MNTVNEALTLLKRQAELETAMKRPGGIRITPRTGVAYDSAESRGISGSRARRSSGRPRATPPRRGGDRG